jgi:hypothetical protein
VFTDNLSSTTFLPTAEKAHPEDLKKFQVWDEHLKAVCRREVEEGGRAIVLNTDNAAPTVMHTNTQPSVMREHGPIERAETATRPKRDLLKADQRRAHDIIEAQLLKRLSGKPRQELFVLKKLTNSAGQNTQQLRMLVLGHGGTGKSMLIGAITETFKAHRADGMLAKCATSGVAAVIIGGQTFHSWAGIPINQPRKESWVGSAHPTVQKRRKQNIGGKQFLILDEVSMCTKQLKYRGSEIVTRVREAEGVGTASECFGGMDIIDFGDFHQFPPVGNPSAALYCDRPDTDDAHATHIPVINEH